MSTIVVCCVNGMSTIVVCRVNGMSTIVVCRVNYSCLSWQVSETLKQQHIEPHWMFALDNQLRDAIRSAIDLCPGRSLRSVRQ